VPQLQTVLSHSISVGFVAVGVAALSGWWRHRDRINAHLAAALGLVAASAFFAEINGLGTHPSPAVSLLAVLALLGSGAALLSLRNLFVPAAAHTRIAAIATLTVAAIFATAATAASPPSGKPSVLQVVAGLATLGLWIACVSEPAMRFLIASRGRPAVQRARLRALSLGFMTIVVVIISAFVAGSLGASTGGATGVVIECMALLAIPLLYVSLAPPHWLRRIWRQDEERAYERATEALMLYARDRSTLARRGLEWAIRLVGADAGAVVAPDNEVLALEGLAPQELAALLRGADDQAVGEAGAVGSGDQRHIVSLALPVGDGPVRLLVVSGPFSPLFGSEERGRLEQYASSIALALDRVRLSEEVTSRSAELEAIIDAIDDLGEGLLVRRNGRVIFANDAYRTITGFTEADLAHNVAVNGAEGEQRRLGEAEVATPDGRRVHVETTQRTVRHNERTLSIEMVRDVTDRKRAERALAHQARLLDFTHDAIMVRSLGPESVVTYWSRGAEKAYGWTSEEMLGRDAHAMLSTVFPQPMPEIEADTLRHGEWEGELLHRRRDGSTCMMASRWALTLDEQGAANGFLEVNRDVTDRHRSEAMKAVQLAAGRALAQSDSMDDAAPAILGALGTNLDWQVAEMWLLDPTEESLTLRHWWHAPGLDAAVFEQAARRLALHREQDLAGLVWRSGKAEFVADVVSDPGCQRRGLAAVLGLHGAAAFPIAVDQKVVGAVTMYSHRARLLDDDILHPLTDLGRQIGGFLERRRTESVLEETVERLEQLAATDPLTGLYNRRAFERALSTVPAEPFAVLAIDVDNLKPINDEYGHEAGDVILQSVATALASIVRERDVVARVGGDEFAVLLAGAKGKEAAAVAERMRSSMHALSVPYGRVRISIGWTAAPAGADARAVWRATDEVLYSAKASGRDCVAGEDFQDRVRPAQSGWNDADVLSEVIANQQIRAVFQPIINLASGEVLGYEALARPAGSEATASVEALFSAARRLGRIRDLDWLCRRAAVRAARELPGKPMLFLNVSAVAFLDPVHPVDQLLLLLTWAGWEPERTVLEITEQEAVRDLARVRFVVAAYREHGVRFAIDDVGEGHSTLELLAATNPEFVKIAGSLTASIADTGPFSAIQAALAFARSSRAQVIAEGIETEEAAEQVRSLGIELGQGYLLGLPAPASDHRAKAEQRAKADQRARIEERRARVTRLRDEQAGRPEG
jgi:diguanylate cyclase (GGDEF)-like protein/PAS domain S-box-containing protein